MPSDPPTYRRQDLNEQVWTEPVREVAKRYGISDGDRVRSPGGITRNEPYGAEEEESRPLARIAAIRATIRRAGRLAL